MEHLTKQGAGMIPFILVYLNGKFIVTPSCSIIS